MEADPSRFRIEALADVRAGQYVVYKGETDERLLMSAPSEPWDNSGQETE